ncbi:MAG: FtsQ-type POTRA domain-containing protein [Alphaproteobacteria bacterium]|nr:MAG: FtsQ-type POTRA domain-containing protein [Alphaproteobacteria bacterium]
MARSSFQKRRIKRFVRRILMPIVLAFSTGFGIFFFYNSYHYRVMNRIYNQFIDTSMLIDMRLKDIHIYNCSQDKQQEVLRRISYKRNSPLFIYNTNIMRQDIEQLPFVKHVSVHKKYPHGIDIYIQQRQPIAQYKYQSQYALVDEEGVFYEYSEEPHKTLPVVSGSNDISKMFPPLFKTMAMYPDIKSKVQVYQLVRDRRWDLIMTDGRKIMLPQHNVKEALNIFQKMKNKDHRVIDLRVKGYIFLDK